MSSNKPVPSKQLNHSSTLSLLLFPDSEILVKAQEGKQQRGEHTGVFNYMAEWDSVELNCLFRTNRSAISLHNKPLQPMIAPLKLTSPRVFINVWTVSFTCQRIRCWGRVILRTPPPAPGWDTRTSSSNWSLGYKMHDALVRMMGFIIVTDSCVSLKLCTDALKSGWTKFKVKVGADLEDDIRRCRLIREMIGPSNTLVSLLSPGPLRLHTHD